MRNEEVGLFIFVVVVLILVLSFFGAYAVHAPKLMEGQSGSVIFIDDQWSQKEEVE